jgi:hypothetical protein
VIAWRSGTAAVAYSSQSCSVVSCLLCSQMENGVVTVSQTKWFLLFHHRPHLWSSGLGSWLQIQRSGFDSRCYQIFWEVVGLERGPLSLVSTTEKLLGRKSRGSGLENRDYDRRTKTTEFFYIVSPSTRFDPYRPSSIYKCWLDSIKQQCQYTFWNLLVKLGRIRLNTIKTVDLKTKNIHTCITSLWGH